MLNPRNLLTTVCFFSAIAATSAIAQPDLPAAKLPTVDLSAEASRPAANDQIHAVLSAEASGVALGDLARQVNALIAEAVKVSRSYPAIKVQSGNTSTYPAYSKSGKIESWRMRSELSLESGDTAAMSELLGKLQTSLGKSYQLKHLSVNTGGRIAEPMFRMAAKSAMSDAAPMPIEAGESQVTANVSGQVELE